MSYITDIKSVFSNSAHMISFLDIIHKLIDHREFFKLYLDSWVH